MNGNDEFLERVTDHISNLDDDDLRSESGVDSFRQFIGPEFRVILTDRSVYMLSLDELRRFPEFLTHLTRWTNMTEVREDHFQYWAWTGSMVAVSRALQAENIAYRRMWPFDNQVLRDLSMLIQMALLPYRHGRQLSQGGTSTYINDPSCAAMLSGSSRLVTMTGFAILEGMLRRYCDETTVDGRLRSYYVSEYEDRSDYSNGGRVYIQDALRLWHDHNANPATAEALNAIRTYDERSRNMVTQLFGELADEIHDLMSDFEDFFEFIRLLRNYTAHGESVTHSLGSIVLNLSCSLYWDAFPDAFFEEYRTNLVAIISGQAEMSVQLESGYNPRDFYPPF